MKKNYKKKKIWISPFKVVCFVFLLIYSLTLLYMYFWGVITSLKTNFDFRHNLYGFPSGKIWEWEWNNYVLAFQEIYVQVDSERIYLLKLLWNSVLFSVSGALIGVYCNWSVSYALAKFKYRFSSVFYKVIIIVMVIPIMGSLATSLRIYRDILGLYDTWWYVIVTSIGISGGSVMVFYAFFLGVGDVYAEAAKIDGANNLMIMFKIMFPLTRQMFLIYFIQGIIPRWNDYMTCVIWLPSIPTIAYAIYKFKDASSNAANWPPLQITACVMMMIPLLTVFLFSKKYIMDNIRIGGVKG